MQGFAFRFSLTLMASLNLFGTAPFSDTATAEEKAIVMHGASSTMKALPKLLWHKGEIIDAVYLKNGNLVTLSPAGALKVWKPSDGSLVETLKATDERITRILPSPDGQRLMGFAMRGVIHQWQLPVPKRSWGPEQMIGEPNSALGDQRTAWASASEDGQNEWVILEYDTAVKPAAIHVYENANPGALVQAAAIGNDGNETVLWEGKDPVKRVDGVNVAKLNVDPRQPVRRLKLYLDSKSIHGWNEIDAVGLELKSGQLVWASSAGASSSYANRSNDYGSIRQIAATAHVPAYAIPKGAVAVSHVDDTAEGKQSFGGSGHAIRFTRDADQTHIAAVEIFGSRYGQSLPPAANFTVYILDQNQKLIKELEFPYAVFQRGSERWQTLSFDPVAVPTDFVVGVNFHAHQSTGVYLGKDTNVRETHSLIGTPTKGYKAVSEKFDWMIRTHLIRKSVVQSHF